MCECELYEIIYYIYEYMSERVCGYALYWCVVRVTCVHMHMYMAVTLVTKSQ